MGKPKYYRLMGLIFVICICVCAGCGGNSDEQKNTLQETTTVENIRYNAEDTVIITDIDQDKLQISAQSIKNQKQIYILSYSSGTSIKNKYDSEILISQVEKGEIVDIYYVSGTQKLIAMKESDKAWENDSVTNWAMDYDNNIMAIGGVNYKYDENTRVISGKKTIDIENISNVDTLVVRGVENQIYSINVKTGHGYIKLADTANFIGGIVEVGTRLMTVITEDMVIVAPEGEYTLTASKAGKGGSVTVKVSRDDEVTVSLSGFQGDIEKNGAVKFNILPGTIETNVFVDGKKVDTSDVVDLSYGVHKLVITSDTYEDYTETFTVNSIYMNKTIDLSTMESETQTQESTTTGGSADNLVTVSKPEGASLYFDGVFKGTIPLTFTKESGKHTVILRRTGYTSVVYNVEFSEDENNVSISFPDLEKSE